MRLCAGKAVLALVLIFGALTASACGGAQTTTTTRTITPATTPAAPATQTTQTTQTRQGTSTATTGQTTSSLPRVGTSQRVKAPGTTMVVTIRSLIDPLRNSGAHLVPGTQAVAILVSVKNAGPGGYDSSSTGDFSLDSAAGQATPVFVARGVCQTPLQDFMNAIGPGETRTGCVAFSVPNGQRPTTVGFAPDGGQGGPRRLWSAG
ncbi:MAG TPA: DUF4352 domain-containing protein [Solirubrobacteraceae bacterium]|nr:DUF4352 domain-containing protein [Solirubrobacteraceae bacterium]